MQAGHIAAQCGASAYACKYIVGVDDDVDVTSLDHLLWAWLTRSDPKESIQFIEGSWDSPADPRLSPSHSWRHRLKTLGRRHGLAPDIVNAISGHGKKSVADAYGEYPAEALYRELIKIPALPVR